MPIAVSRRDLLCSLLMLPIAGATQRSLAAPMALEPTPACGDDPEPTPPQTAGPFYTPRSPQRTSLLEPGDESQRMVLEGRVVDTGCQPIAGAWIDLWHADPSGRYDNDGYRYRGHQLADAQGNFRFETARPGLYPGRTRHFHLKLKSPNAAAALTTQLYFPEEPGNARDALFDNRLLMTMETRASGDGLGRYLFVLG